jgi:hypothetical protein
MSVLAIISVTVLSSTMNALGTTTSTRASMQARAAAEAGIDVATAGLQTTGSCTNVTGVYSSAVEPEFEAVIAYDEGAGWVNGCPTFDSVLVRVTSTGAASSKGVAGATAGDEVTLEAVFNYDDIIVQVPIVGSAVYAHTIVGVLKKFELKSAGNSVATSVTIKNGDVSCSNNAKIGGDLILGDGNANLNMCTVDGSVAVNGNVTANSSHIGGDLRATGTVTKSADTTVGGTVAAGSATGLRPIPTWSDVPSAPAHWTAAGYTVVDWTGPCTITDSTAEWANLTNYTTKTAINFLAACPSSPVITNNNVGATVSLKTDLVFIAEEFTFNKLRFRSSSTTEERKLAFIVPDDETAPADTPTCAPPAGMTGNITLTNETDFGPLIAAMVYTPCKVISDRGGFRGQMYGGEVEFGQQASLTFVQVGIPGVDLTRGLTTPVKSGAKLGDGRSWREIP